MGTIDWALILSPLALLLGLGIYSNRYLRGVSDFLTGGRVAGRYLISTAKGEMAVGAVCFAAGFESTGNSGFTVTWWSWINIPVGILVALSGFVIYRYRETRCMTLAQFFEVRYSKAFRIFTGVLGFFAGIVNFGIMPVVSARFLTHFMGFPPEVHCGSWQISTYILVMAVLLSVTVFMALTGGVITLMITSSVEGMLSNVFYLVIIAGLVSVFDWKDIGQTLADRPPGHSLVNPFDSFSLKDFNLWYVLMGMLVNIYGTMAWQNQSAFNSAAATAHESRMGSILGRWREVGTGAVTPLLVVCALTFLHHPHFAHQAASAHQEIAAVADAQTRKQMTIPIALEHLLPAGVKGAFCIIMIMGSFGGDSSHIHSWGSLLIQDVIVPLRRQPFRPEQHIRLLRFAIAGVALFAFVFGIFFRQTEYIIMWWQVTMALYVGGAGAAIIGGLYWKKGTVAGAWTALLAGSGLSTGGILARQAYGESFPFNGMQISFVSCLVAMALYAGVSLLTCREDFDLNRMLHRNVPADRDRKVDTRRFGWSRLLGTDENFTVGDRWTAGLLFAWSMLWCCVLAVGTIWNLISPWPVAVWLSFWHVTAIGSPAVLALVTAVWFIWGGVGDVRALFRRLHREKTNSLDNGMVVDHQNLDDAVRQPATVPARVLEPEELPR